MSTVGATFWPAAIKAVSAAGLLFMRQEKKASVAALSA